MELIAVDVETTGLDASSEAIVEIAAVRFRSDGEILDTFVTLVNPGRHIPTAARQVHGISDSLVADAPIVQDVMRKFGEWCGPVPTLVAHNAPFDAEFIHRAARGAGVRMNDWKVIDTLRWARNRFPNLANYRLETLLRHIRYTPDGELHRALADARGVVALTCALLATYAKSPGSAVNSLAQPIYSVVFPPATERQLWRLRRLGVKEDVLENLTKGEASRMISAAAPRPTEDEPPEPDSDGIGCQDLVTTAIVIFVGFAILLIILHALF